MGMIGNTLAQGLISGANIVDGTVDTPDIKDGAVTTAKIANGAVITADIADGAVTPAKLSTGAPKWNSSNSFFSVGANTLYPLHVSLPPATVGGIMHAVDPSSPNNAAATVWNNTGSGSLFAGRAAPDGSNPMSVTLAASAPFFWNSGSQKMFFGNGNATAFTIDGSDQSAVFTAGVTAPGFVLRSGVSGAGNMQFQCTAAGTTGTGYCGVNAYTSGVFGLGSASGTNQPVEFYTNGGLAARVTTGRGNGGFRLVTAGVGLTATGSTYSGGFSAGMSNIGGGSRNNSVIISGNYATGGGFPQYVSNWASGGAWGLGPDTGSNDSYLRLGLWGEDADGFYWQGTYINLKVSTLTQTSDYRIKENVRLYEQDALAVLRLFSPKRFNKIVHQDPSITEPPVIRDEIGYIAHEVQEHIPELVTGVKDAVDANGSPIIQGMDYDRMGAVLHRAVLQLDDKLTALQAEFTQYKAAHP